MTPYHGNPIIYRKATEDDWDNLANFRNLYSFEGFQDAKKTFEIDFISNAEPHQNILFIAELESEIIGYGRAGYFDRTLKKPIYGQVDTVPNGYYTKGVLVHEKVRGLRVGLEPTELRSQWVKQYDEKLYCILNKNNTVSMSMHIKNGFKENIRNLKYPKDSDGQLNGVLLYKDLKQEEND